ncbi:MAG: TonB-dependent receptor [Muribaculaceae bacterium]|nr:TonB-dependent receptor [Muribaculaceae bacterium]
MKNLDYKATGQGRRSQHAFGRLIALCLGLLISFSISAQNITVKGTVLDQEGEPITGASVIAVGTTQGVATDIDGNFTLSVPSNGKIKVSYIGYKPQEIPVNGKSTINVTLQEDTNVLDEVVAIGYATVKRRDLTGATSSVGSKELLKVPATTAAQALQGKAAGVNITTNSGAPGAGNQITIRGGMSITQSTEPLYIVDGFEMANALDHINVNDIESIDVLKDASATAIYGARGSNGIILITTKSGQKGKTSVSYNAFFSFDKLSKKVDMMDDPVAYAAYQYEFAVQQNKVSGYASFFDDNYGQDQDDFFSGAVGRYTRRYAGYDAIDWQDEVFGGNAFTQSHNVSVSTGNEKLQALVSYNYNGQDGFLKNHDYKNNSFRTRLNAELWKGVRFDMNALFTGTDTHGGGSYSGLRNVLLQPIIGGTMFTRDEMLTTQTSPNLSGMESGYDTPQPIVANNATVTHKRNYLYSVNGGIEIDFLKHFTWRTAGGYKYNSYRDDSFSDQNSLSYILNAATTGMTGSIKNYMSENWQLTNTLRYHQDFNKVHHLDVLFGQEMTHAAAQSNSITLKKFPNPNFGLNDISMAEVSDKGSSRSHSGILSFFGRVNYNFADRYLLTATLRGDGSTKFARGHRWGVFPSAAGAWRISQEKFFEESPLSTAFNNLKLRVGYGTTGNCNIGSYLYNTVFNTTSYPVNDNIGNVAYVPSTTMGNPDLKWETLHSTNVGLDLSVLNGRIDLSVDWYNNQISDLLMKSVVPTSTGYADQYQNVGKMRNRGWEISLNTVNITNRHFQWTSNLNLSFNRSKVLELDNDNDFKLFNVGSNRGGQVRYYASVGERLGDMWGYKYEGIYTTDDFTYDDKGNLVLKPGVVIPLNDSGAQKAVQPGDIKFAANGTDADGNPTFTAGEFTKIGNGTPKMFGGFSNSFMFYGFDVNIFLKFAVGNDIYNATRHSMSPYALFQNVTKEFGENYYRMIDPATGAKTTDLETLKALNPDESSRVWNLSLYNSTMITFPSSYYVEDGSYLRVAQVTVGYTIPANITRKAHISNLRVYFTGNNLLTWTKYSGYDPEVSAGNSDAVACTPGYDSSMYPRSRSYVIGLNLSF